MNTEALKFKVAPHIVEDLGLNLYTDLARVLVEFVANSYDADSPSVKILFDKTSIDAARRVLKAEYERDKAAAEATGEKVEPLETRPLPAPHKIIIQDSGHGMSRDDLGNKFLVAGRRRRKEEPECRGRSPRGRPLMGRKGIGKLAGFGVAKKVEVVTRKEGESHATMITLNYDDITTARATHEIPITEARLDDGGGLTPSGTRITLSGLMYGPLKNRAQTIENALAEHFALLKPEEFQMEMNGATIAPPAIGYAFAWPNSELPPETLVSHKLPREAGGDIEFQYRLRFTEEGKAVPAALRGVRIYSNSRLASAPSLLDMDTNMHGFRMTDYLDGVVVADFIDQEDADYIATDRQTVRWESPLLSGLHDFLSEEMKKACAAYQKTRDDTAPSIVRDDPFTKGEIQKYNLSKRDARMAIRLGVILKNSCKRGVEDPAYKTKLPVFIKGIGHGNILAAISKLADDQHPDFEEVVSEVAKLTADEFDSFVSYAKARLRGIVALKKVVREVSFRDKHNEALIQRLFEENPWLINPMYKQFLSADEKFDIVLPRLAEELSIGRYAPKDADQSDERPDLVFLLGNRSLDRLVIVELKSANLPLESKHLDQLQTYMQSTEDWLREHGRPGVKIEGHLIGSMAPIETRARGVMALRRRISDAGPEADWAVRDYIEVLTDTETAHSDLVAIHDRLEQADAATEASIPEES